MAYSAGLANMVKQYMTNHGFSFDFDEKNGFFHTDFTTDDGEFALDFGVAVLEDALVSYALFPDRITKLEEAKISEYLHRANYGLIFGNFEINYETGMIQYKCFMPAPEDTFDADLIQDIFAAPAAVISRYAGGIYELMDNPELDPKDLIERIENSNNQ